MVSELFFKQNKIYKENLKNLFLSSAYHIWGIFNTLGIWNLTKEPLFFWNFNDSFAYDWYSTIGNLLKILRVLEQLIGCWSWLEAGYKTELFLFNIFLLI